MILRSAVLWASLAVIAGTGVLYMKNEVATEEQHLRHVQKAIFATTQSIHVLKAEWSYLNDPIRLREQAERHLGMHPMRANQIVTVGILPKPGDEPNGQSEAAMVAKQQITNHNKSPKHHDQSTHALTIKKTPHQEHAKKPSTTPHKGATAVKVEAKLQHPLKIKISDPELASTRMRP